jgi:hypothetical protein
MIDSKGTEHMVGDGEKRKKRKKFALSADKIHPSRKRRSSTSAPIHNTKVQRYLYLTKL